MLPMRFFRNRTFAAANVASLSCSSGCSARSSCSPSTSRPCRATRRSRPGLRILPWTAMPIFVAPIAGAALRPDRRPPDHGRRARAAGNRARLDRSDPHADAPLLEHRDPVRPLRHRDGAVLRAGRQRRPLARSSPRRRARHRARTTPSASSAASSASQSSPRSSPTTAATRRAAAFVTASRRRSTSAPPSSPSEQRPPCSSRGSASPRPKPHTPCPPVSSRPSSRQRPRHLHPSRPGASRSGPESRSGAALAGHRPVGFDMPHSLRLAASLSSLEGNELSAQAGVHMEREHPVVEAHSGSRICGSTAASSSRTRAGGLRSASLSTGPPRRSSPSRSSPASTFHH